VIPPGAEQEGPPTLPAGLETVRTESGLEYLDIERGKGREVRAGARVRLRARTWLTDGTLVDSTEARGGEDRLTLGRGEGIAGLEEGLLGMRAGGRRRLIIPSDLAYGPRGRAPAIPPYATLIMDVEVAAVS
jgi:peptidylprolyl isomerase